MNPFKFIAIIALAAGLYHPTIDLAADIFISIIICLEIIALLSARCVRTIENRSLIGMLSDTASAAVIIALLIAHDWGMAAGLYLFASAARTTAWLAAREKQS